MRETDCCVLTQQSVSCCGFLWKDDILHIVHKETADMLHTFNKRMADIKGIIATIEKTRKQFLGNMLLSTSCKTIWIAQITGFWRII